MQRSSLNVLSFLPTCLSVTCSPLPYIAKQQLRIIAWTSAQPLLLLAQWHHLISERFEDYGEKSQMPKMRQQLA